ncbi:SMR family transporter [Denitrificimonas caeni]|uniref:SMR family transporter n=1 Tax=Denitrificimonas caeni TaxID=521720 RepID=UPI0019638077|nr:multidrug efflux SMR transporter [Denitrificimonas caeni]
MYYWCMLVLAVIAEVVSTVGMKYASTSSPIAGYLLMALMISLSFYAFSRAVVHIPLAVSYAIWEGMGLFLIGVAGVVLFGEYLSVGEMFAIALMLVGLLLVTFDKGKHAEDEHDEQLASKVAIKPVQAVRIQVKPVRVGTLGEVAL